MRLIIDFNIVALFALLGSALLWHRCVNYDRSCNGKDFLFVVDPYGLSVSF